MIKIQKCAFSIRESTVKLLPASILKTVGVVSVICPQLSTPQTRSNTGFVVFRGLKILAKILYDSIQIGYSGSLRRNLKTHLEIVYRLKPANDAAFGLCVKIY